MIDSRLWILRFALAVFLSSAQHFIYAQMGTEKPSSMKGMLIEQPERLSGVWEAAIGSGKVIGLHFTLTTKTAGAITTPGGVPHYQEDLAIGVYQRSGKDLVQNYFADSPDEGVLWDGKHLILRWAPRSTDEPAIGLNLQYDDEQQTWTGLHRGGFSENVTLRRPVASTSDSVSRLIGTWVSLQPGMNGCVHIGQSSDGTLEGWSDDLMTPELSHYAKGLKAPEETFETYGDLVRVTQTDRDKFSIEFKAYAPMCCSHIFAGTMSADNSLLSGSWQAGPKQSLLKSTWKKVRGDSCR